MANPAVDKRTTEDECNDDGTFEVAITTGEENVVGNVTVAGTVM
jgi:hypothetical protein